MSHPFTPEYMMEGETLSNEIGGKIENRSENQDMSGDSQMKSGLSTGIQESESVIEACQTGQVEDNPDVDIERIKVEMNINIADKDRLSFFKITRMAMRRRMEAFAQEVSILGLSYLVKPSSYKVGSIIRKVVWTMLLLFGVGFMVFQMYDRISYYLAYPTVVSYRVAYNQSLRFPTVTICTENLISKKAITSLGPQIQTFASNRYPPIWDMDFGDSFKALNLSQMDFDGVFFQSYTTTKLKDMILECSFGNQPCDSSDAFKQSYSDENCCLSFNPVTKNYVTTQPGANYGLRLVLWVNQSDAHIIASPGDGYKVALHDPHDMSIVKETGFRVGTGTSTSVSFTLRNVSMLPSPYGDCRQAENYTFQICVSQCMGNYILSKCRCRAPELDVSGPLCSMDEGYNCVPKYLRLFISSLVYRQCDCPLQCYQPTYPYSVSKSPLSQHFLNYMSQRSQFKGRNMTMSKLSKELVFLDIFYSQLSYIDIQTTPAYDFLTLVSDIGGSLGLILGGTLLTIAEFLQFFVQVFGDLVTSARLAQMRHS